MKYKILELQGGRDALGGDLGELGWKVSSQDGPEEIVEPTAMVDALPASFEIYGLAPYECPLQIAAAKLLEAALIEYDREIIRLIHLRRALLALGPPTGDPT